MTQFNLVEDPRQLADVERRAHEMRAEATARAFRDFSTWIKAHMHFGGNHTTSH